ncbi:MAG TPA: hypothetical protein VJ583_03005 [Nitrososphaeraceae archaeon]|jgi:hypothetical protein|nr:hypothetical protein [Nitrososphaeraceae archaeon]
MNSTNTIINPKPCNYNCGTRIYWNNEEMLTLKYLVKRSMFVRIGAIKLLLRIIILVAMVIIVNFIAKR